MRIGLDTQILEPTVLSLKISIHNKINKQYETISPVHNPNSPNTFKTKPISPFMRLFDFPSMRRQASWSYFEASYFKMFAHLAHLKKKIDKLLFISWLSVRFFPHSEHQIKLNRICASFLKAGGWSKNVVWNMDATTFHTCILTSLEYRTMVLYTLEMRFDWTTIFIQKFTGTTHHSLTIMNVCDCRQAS